MSNTDNHIYFAPIFENASFVAFVYDANLKTVVYSNELASVFISNHHHYFKQNLCSILKITHLEELPQLPSMVKNGYIKISLEIANQQAGQSQTYLSEIRKCTIQNDLFYIFQLELEKTNDFSKWIDCNQEFVQKIIDLVPDPIFVKDHERRFLLVNQKFAEYHDMPIEDIIGKRDEDIKTNAEESRPFIIDDNFVINNQKPKLIHNETYTNPAGEKITLRTTKVPYYFPKLNSQGLIGIAINITDKIHLKHKILNNRKMQRQIIDLVPHVIYLKDSNGKYVFVNKEFLKRIAKEEQQVIGYSDYDLYPTEKAKRNEADDNEVKTTLKEKIVEKDFGQLYEGALAIYRTIKQPYFDYETGKVGILAISTDLTEKLRNKEQLDHQKNILNEIINLLPHEIYLKDDQGKLLLVNKTCADIHQTTPEELIGKTDFDLFEHRYAQQFYDIEQSVLKDGSFKYIAEEESVDKYNEARVKSVIKMPFYLSDKKKNGILGLNIDITESKTAERKIRESEIRYKTLMEQASDGIYLSDDDGNIISANQKAAEIFGYTIEEFMSLNIKKIVVNDISISKGLRMPYSADKNSLILERKFIKKDGSTFTAELSVKLLDQGKHQAILRDVTERKKLEKILSDSEKKFRLLIENSSDLILILSENFIIKYISPSINRILGFTESELLGHSILNLLAPSDSELASTYLSKVIQSEETGYAEIQLATSHKTYLLFETIAVNLLSDENINGIVINCHDITKRKNTETELIHTNFELDSFVYKASHDLKAPLRSVMGLIKLAKLENKSSELEVYFEMMSKSVISLDNFIKDLTLFSRNARIGVEYSEIDFDNILSETLDNLKFVENADKISVRKSINLTEKFYSDKSRISTILNNLLSNAFKYHRFENNLPYIEINVSSDADKAVVTVKDNGIGIEQKHIDNIFDMFYRASETSYGSGLGLYILKNAVQKIKGTVEVVSNIGEGTTFTIHIPNYSIVAI